MFSAGDVGGAIVEWVFCAQGALAYLPFEGHFVCEGIVCAEGNGDAG